MQTRDGSAFGGDSWKEEVLLHDGSKIWLLHAPSSVAGGMRSGSSPRYKEQGLTFTMPGINQNHNIGKTTTAKTWAMPISCLCC